MNRKALEKKIIKSLLSRVVGFKLVSEDYSSKFNHLSTFSRKIEDLTYVVVLRFMKPNYLKLQVQFMIFSDKINDELKGYMKYSNDFGLSIIDFDMEDYFHHLDSQSERDFYIDDDRGLGVVDADSIAERIYQRYFSVIESDLLNTLGSLEKISEILNDKNSFHGEQLRLSVFCFPEQVQVLGGVMSTLLVRGKECHSTIKKYWDYSLDEYQIGEDQFIDGFWRYMEKNHAELL